MDNRKIGVFDSGIGGLTVVKALFDVLPNEGLIYFGDSLHVPYGNRPKAEITRLASRIVKFLINNDIKAIVAACNTVSSLCIDEIRDIAQIPVIDVLTPGAAAAAKAASEGVGVIATFNAVQSGAHKEIIHKVDPLIEVYALSCPLLVPIVEEGLCETEIAYVTARHYLSQLNEDKIDCLLLGCTHYPLLMNALKAATQAPLFDPAVYAAAAIKDCLAERNAFAEEDTPGRHHEFFTSGNVEAFKNQVQRILGFLPKCERALY